ncbi:MAG: glycosyltransferase family 4 protein [Deltaproteobacteria bacterium]|nr:glycosyltransferase family 4 protein [Deltaproteobacteria bacterium]
MRITIDARMIRYTGIGRYIQNLIENLCKIDGKHTFGAVVNSGDEGEIKEAGNLEIFKTRSRIPVYSIREQVLLPSEIKRSGPDLAHYPSFNMPLLNGTPAVATIHDLIYYLNRGSCPNALAYLYARFIFKKVVKKAQKIITVSEFTKGEVVRHLGVKADKVVVIHNGVSHLYRPVDKEKRGEVLSKYGIKGGYIFYVGNHQPRKNLVRLVQAFSALKNRDHQLVLTGRIDPRRADLYGAVNEKVLEGRVLCIGPVPEEDLPALYSGASVFAFPSLSEGFGLPPLEAMACGAPVVSSNATSLPEVVGEAGLLVDPLDVSSIARGIDMALASPALQSELKEKGLQRAKKFSWEAAAKKTLKVYEEVVNR